MSGGAVAPMQKGRAVILEADDMERRLRGGLLHGDPALGLVALGFMLGRFKGRTGRSDATLSRVMEAIALGRIAGQGGR